MRSAPDANIRDTIVEASGAHGIYLAEGATEAQLSGNFIAASNGYGILAII